jgi:hypothetical protein
MMRTLVAIALAAAAWRLIPTAAHAGGSAAEACLDAPTVACITEHFADGADLPLRAIPAARRDTPTTWLLRALRILGRADEAEQVAWREERGTHAPDRATDIAVARSVAAARAGGVLDPDLLDVLADLASPLAPLTRATGSRESVAWQAHWMAAYALLGGLATDAGVAEARDAPVAARTALRESPAWRGLMEGLARWNARVPPVHRPLGWRILATFRLDLDDPDGARDALDRSEAAPATGDEIASCGGASATPPAPKPVRAPLGRRGSLEGTLSAPRGRRWPGMIGSAPLPRRTRRGHAASCAMGASRLMSAISAASCSSPSKPAIRHRPRRGPK